MTPYTHITKTAWIMLASLSLASSIALAQSRTPTAPILETAATGERVTQLEAKVARLEGEVTLLRERLEALLGTEPRFRVYDLPVGNSPVRGAPSAAVTLVMFGDYQSDYTARAQQVVRRLLETYPQKLRFVYKHYPLTQIHPLANEAALAALAAERQGLFWEFHDRLLENSRRLDATRVLMLAEETGLDLSRFEQDRRSLAALSRLSEDEKMATAAGVNGLPTVFLNGRMMETWRFDFLKGQIDRLLAEQ